MSDGEKGVGVVCQTVRQEPVCHDGSVRLSVVCRPGPAWNVVMTRCGVAGLEEKCDERIGEVCLDGAAWSDRAWAG